MKINPGIFKEYDIRAIYPDEANEEVAYKIGRAYAYLLKSEIKKSKINIAVGYDMRQSSISLTKAIIKGVINEGINVANIGLVSTPTFYFGVARYGYDG